MPLSVLLTALVAFLISLVVTRYMLRFALARGLIDVPNARSSHQRSTPRGGGVGIVVGSSLAFTILALVDRLPLPLYAALMVGGLAVAVVGLIDDRKSLSAGVRLAVHAIAAIVAVILLGGLPPVQLNDVTFQSGPGGYVVATIAIIWGLNLFNFMDGIDGIAGSEAAFVAAAGTMLALLSDAGDNVAPAALVFACACLGFLRWNWPPARIFMGDVGSGYAGYVLALLAISSGWDVPSTPLAWLILGGAFVVDATLTLIRRLSRRERIFEAHRSHAYQWLARQWGSHARVTVSVLALNVLWLFPAAVMVSLYPQHDLWICLVALVPVIALALVCGAGRPEVKANSAGNVAGDS